MLVDHLDRVALEGVAADLVRGLPPAQPRTRLQLDFEDGAWAPLRRFPALGSGVGGGEAGIAVIEGSRAYAGGRSVELVGDGRGALSLRTPPIPVSPHEVYALRYRVASDGIAPETSGERARATVLLYRLESGEATAAEWLAAPDRERAARLAEAPSLSTSGDLANHPWRERHERFSTGPLATHMVLSFDLGRATDDDVAYRARGRVRFDDIALRSVPVPLSQRALERDDGMGDPHPLARSAELEHPAHPDATERRYALSLPAPSALHFVTRVPEAGVLSFGYGVLRAARVPGAAPLTFSVEVQPESGDTEELHRGELDPAQATGWRDVDVDLARFAGRSVRVILRSQGRPPPADAFAAAQRLPEGGCIVSAPVLSSRGHPGRLVLLVVVDTLPARRTSTYGHARDTTPNLTRIAADGTRFARALSPSSWTLPAFASIFTGLTPPRHRAGEPAAGAGFWRRPLADGFVTLAERLRRAGWDTRAWINNPNLTARVGLQQGFATFVDYGTRTREAAAEPGVADLLEALETPSGLDRLFVFHLMDPHGPYRPADAYRRRFQTSGDGGRLRDPLTDELWLRVTWGALVPGAAERARLRDRYDAVVAYTDEQIGRIYDAARSAAASEFAFIATADHGEEFWDHAAFEHGQSVYDELLRVPLVLVAPGRTPAGRVVDAPVSTRDLAATILELAGIAAPADVSPSLLAAPRGAPPDGARALVSGQTLYGVERLALERGGVKYIYNQLANGVSNRRAPQPTRRHELYDLSRDPGETDNRFAAELPTARALHEALASEFALTLGGDYAVVFDAGSDAGVAPPQLEGHLVLPAGARWLPAVKEFVWPFADGRDGELEVDTSWSYGAHRMSFRLRAPRALLGFAVRDGAPEGAVKARLLLDGRLAPARIVAVGGGGAPPTGLPIELEADADPLSVEALLEAHDGPAPRVRIGRVRPGAEHAGSAAAPGLDADLRQQLEALGYVE
ncbi:MAG: sulfatase [Deltaproteobacteria bacterium]|nr:MAG: sulfatase [Deltaproteobacteria bacterium]